MADECSLPTRDEIATLPRWARVAFAARCARRVLPLFRAKWTNAPPEQVLLLKHAVDFSELSASRAVAIYEHVHGGHLPIAVRLATQAGNIAVSAPREVQRVAYAAANAARAAAFAHPLATFDAVSEATSSRLSISPILNDFQAVRNLSQAENWTDDTPVPPCVFGPLWPDGRPEGWPADEPPVAPAETTPKQHRLVISATAKSGVSADALGAKMHELFEAINAYHIARGGGRLTPDDIKMYVAAGVPAEVG